MCTETGISEFETRWGSDYADRPRQICEGRYAGPMDGGTGAGSTSALPPMACLMERESTRTERLNASLHACLDSLRGGGDRSPIPPTGQKAEIWEGIEEIHKCYGKETQSNLNGEPKRIVYDNNGSLIGKYTFSKDAVEVIAYNRDDVSPESSVTLNTKMDVSTHSHYRNNKVDESMVVRPDNSYVELKHDKTHAVISEQE